MTGYMRKLILMILYIELSKKKGYLELSPGTQAGRNCRSQVAG